MDVPDPRERGILEGRVFLRLDPRKLHLLEADGYSDYRAREASPSRARTAGARRRRPADPAI